MRFISGTQYLPKRLGVSHVFLRVWLPKSRGEDVKLYLYLLYLLEEKRDIELDELCETLEMGENRVLEGIAYWCREGLMRRGEDGEVSVFDADDLMLESLLPEHPTAHGIRADAPTPEDELIEANKRDDIREYFSEAEYIIRRALVPEEKKRLLRWLKEFNMSAEMILHAVSYTYEEKTVRTLSYVEGILRNWYDKGYTRLDDVIGELLPAQKGPVDLVASALNLKERDLTPAARSMIESWRQMGFSDEVIRFACAQTVNIREPNVNYVNAVLQNWKEEGVRTLDDAQAAVRKRPSKRRQPREDILRHDGDDLDDILTWKGRS